MYMFIWYPPLTSLFAVLALAQETPKFIEIIGFTNSFHDFATKIHGNYWYNYLRAVRIFFVVVKVFSCRFQVF